MFAVAMISFFLSPFIVHRLGNEAYGVWILLYSIVGYLGLLDLGVRSAVTKYLATLYATEQHEEANHIASAALALFAAAGFFAVLSTFALAQVGLGWFDVSPELLGAARLVLQLGGLTVASAIIGGVFGGIVVARQRLDLLNLVSLIHEIVRAAAIVFALSDGGGIVALAVIQLLTSLSLGLVTFALSRRVYPEVKPWRFQFRRDHLQTVLSFGFFATLLHASTMIVNYTDSLVIGAFLPISMITFFAISANLVEQARNLSAGISRSVSPVASALDVERDRSRVGQVLLSGARLSSLVCFPIVVTFLLRGHSFIGLWMGEEFAKPAGDVLFVLALGLWVYAGFHVCVAIIIGIDEHRGLVPAFIAEAICNAVLSILLVEHYGLLGVAFGTLIPRAVMSLAFGPLYTRRVVGVPVRRYLGDVVLRPTLSMAFFAAATWATERYFPAANLAVYFAQVAVACPLALVGAWAMCLTAEERAQLRGLVRRSA